MVVPGLSRGVVRPGRSGDFGADVEVVMMER
ncbi:hypothetical protein V525_09170 [Gordonia alkanivorans CGMCC 6845]|uniref:Uncharacterized protein n=1 Tax=Gordonia alkanivorans CGMCC 6845 TaxID=1423140 RepID=W9DGQ5_9ACTN|nr:hypothetical protein V525_09170 [Gordonia alkanivorans CGMCC 6845]